MLCRWFRKFAQPVAYRYITLGGTELRDVQSINFVDSAFASDSVSYESDQERYALASLPYTFFLLNVDMELNKNR
jgi:hypothetical protein